MAVSYVGVNKEFAGAWQDSGMTELLSGQGMSDKEINRVIRKASRNHWDSEEQTAKEFVGDVKKLVGGDAFYKDDYGSLFRGTSLEGTINSMHTPTAAERLDNYAQNYDVKNGMYTDAQIKSINRRINKLNGVKNTGSQYTEQMQAESEMNRTIHAAEQRRNAKENLWGQQEASAEQLAAEDNLRDSIRHGVDDSTVSTPKRQLRRQSGMKGRKLDLVNWGEDAKTPQTPTAVQKQIDSMVGAPHSAANKMIAEKMEQRGKTSVYNVMSRMDRLRSKIDRIDNADRETLQRSFSEAHLNDISKKASHFTLKENMANKLGYVKAAAKNVTDFFIGGNTGGGHIRAHRESIQRKIEEREMDMMREQKKAPLQKSMDNHQKLLDRINNGDNEALQATQTKRGTRQILAQDCIEKRAAAKAEQMASKGLGWKGKAGAVAGLLALGGIIGNQFAGGHKSNAELYNPNPQPQYYS